MSGTPAAIDRATVVALLATWRDRDPADVGERIGSLELAWLVQAVEERYRVLLRLDDAQLDRMETVTGAVAVLADHLREAA